MKIITLLMSTLFLFGPAAAQAEEQLKEAYLSGLHAGILIGACLLYANDRLERANLDWLYGDIRASKAGKTFKPSVDSAVETCQKNGVDLPE